MDEEEPVTGRATGIFQVNTLTTGQSLKTEFCTKKDKYGFALDASSEYEASVINCFRHLLKSTTLEIWSFFLKVSFNSQVSLYLKLTQGRTRNKRNPKKIKHKAKHEEEKTELKLEELAKAGTD